MTDSHQELDVAQQWANEQQTVAQRITRKLRSATSWAEPSANVYELAHTACEYTRQLLTKAGQSDTIDETATDFAVQYALNQTRHQQKLREIEGLFSYDRDYRTFLQRIWKINKRSEAGEDILPSNPQGRTALILGNFTQLMISEKNVTTDMFRKAIEWADITTQNLVNTQEFTRSLKKDDPK